MSDLEEEFSQRPLKRSLLVRLIGYLRPYRRMALLALGATILATLSQLLGPKLVQIGIDHYLTEPDGTEVAIRGILVVSAIYLANLLFGWGITVANVTNAATSGQSAVNDLREDVFRHIQTLSLSYFDKTHQGRIIARADSDISNLEHIMTWGANQIVSSLLTLTGALVVMLNYDARLCLAVSLVLPPLCVATWLFRKYGTRAHRRVREQNARLTSAFAETISGVRVVQSMVREDFNLAWFLGLHREYTARAIESARIFHTYMPFIGLMSGVGVAIILGYGGFLVLRGDITAGTIAAFVLYLGMFFGPVATMGELYNQMLSAGASAERIFDLLDTDPEVRDLPDAKPLPRLRGEVEFRKVSFKYPSTPGDTWVLEEISFHLQPGQTLALVGPTGSGKTSIISLLARFYEPWRGAVLVDGINIQTATLHSLHRQIGIVTQENFLFTGSIMENLKFGRPNASDDEVYAAARRLGTHDLICGLDRGYDTPVGERGGNLSAGQRQLLCITRAMVADPRILILDEATSAIDPANEQRIQHAMSQLFEKRTCVVIAHRLSTVRNADIILVLQKGRIVERGNHAQLLALGGIYSRLHAEFTS
ncbi:MAG: ABC transporter ATP-binding protein [Verrucomicrobiia bacterium]